MRSKKKGYFLDRRASTKKKIWSRRSVITANLLDHNVEIHNGKQFVNLKITPQMIGHKFGEFAFTRKIYQYKKGKKK